MQTADYWQLLFSDRFTGARNPARLPTTDAIPSNPLRPLSISFYHLRVAHFALSSLPLGDRTSDQGLAWRRRSVTGPSRAAQPGSHDESESRFNHHSLLSSASLHPILSRGSPVMTVR